MAKNKEPYIAVCKMHWSAFLPCGVIEISQLAIAISLLFSPKSRATAGVFFCIALVFGIVMALCILICYKTTYIALTGTKVIGHKGFIRSKTLMTPLSKIQNVGLGSDLLGKIFNYHTVTLSDAGGGKTEYVFPKMAHAQEFADAVHEAMEKFA